jgi:hypothetical protein
MPSYYINIVYFLVDKRFVRPSAIMLADLTYSSRRRLA